MRCAEKLTVVVDGPKVDIVPHCGDDAIDATPCTFRNATDRTVYVWHWLGTDTLYHVPCLLRPIGVGQTVTIYYPSSFYARATFGHDFRSTVIEELTVGDVPRHIVLLSEAHAPAFAI